MVGIWHRIDMLSSKINMINQNKYFFMSLGSKKEVTEKQFSGSCAKVSLYALSYNSLCKKKLY